MPGVSVSRARPSDIRERDRETMVDNKMTLPGLTIDGVACTGTPLRHVWNECVGAGRANEALRADWQRHF